MGHLSKQWSLKSLTVGPQIHETNAQFWEEAFEGLPPLPGVRNVTIICYYPTVKAFNTDCWKYFDHLLIRRDLFPALTSVYVSSSSASQQLSPQKWSDIYASLHGIRTRGLGPRRRSSFRSHLRWAIRAHVSGQGELLGLKRCHRTDSLQKHSSDTQL